ALRKLREKNLDLIVANDLEAADGGFGADTNEVMILRRDGSQREVSRRLKTEVAEIILDEIEQLLSPRDDVE
ncbi:MAG: bifunctional 4'-phosphopantothenoylcysteine decarboxylase/phosphopantothenoylcysteine synthetase, partial [Armatimonadetes bacterium]|nr:bifunctional 4'-phosphopantothenoylcysteine decarboxylase/phosphopantothenoylcysteine synthetase [Armatimonadota bacterium]